MFCTACGSKIEDGAAHCTSCGAKVGVFSVTAAALSQNANSIYSSLDPSFRKSCMLGGGSILLTILSFFVGGFMFLLAPGAAGLGIAAMVAGRDLENPTGYYLGVIGTSAASALFFIGLAGYAIYSGLLELRGNMLNSLL